MIFEVISLNGGNTGSININGAMKPCFLGKNGTILANLKREGDGKTPIGKWKIRKIFYRADKFDAPISAFQTEKIHENDGWCDAPEDENYNKFISHPYKASAEKLWRNDELYDICVVLGHNDDPVVPFMGSAIFMHCTKPNYKFSEGCVALDIEDLRQLLKTAAAESFIEIVS